MDSFYISMDPSYRTLVYYVTGYLKNTRNNCKNGKTCVASNLAKIFYLERECERGSRSVKSAFCKGCFGKSYNIVNEILSKGKIGEKTLRFLGRNKDVKLFLERRGLYLLSKNSNSELSENVIIENFLNATELTLSHNHLSVLPDYIFKMKKLESILFYDLQSLKDMTKIDAFVNLKTLRICRCVFKTVFLPESMPQMEKMTIEGTSLVLPEMPNLKSLKIISSNIKTIPLEKFPKLQKLKLESMYKLKTYDFENIQSLKVLKVECFRGFLRIKNLEQLQKLNINTETEEIMEISGIPNLRKLCIISSSPKDVSFISNLQNLESLCFSGGVIDKIPKDLEKLKFLKSLDIDFCRKIRDVSEIEKLKTLESLSLNRLYKIKSIPDLSDFLYLRHLDIGYCENLAHIPSFKKLKLETLSLINLSPIPDFGELPFLKKIRFLHETFPDSLKSKLLQNGFLTSCFINGSYVLQDIVESNLKRHSRVKESCLALLALRKYKGFKWIPKEMFTLVSKALWESRGYSE